MPGHNLTLAIESVLVAMDGRSDFEVVVVDDASPEPIQLVASHDRLRLVPMSENVGAVPNFNLSLIHI